MSGETLLKLEKVENMYRRFLAVVLASSMTALCAAALARSQSSLPTPNKQTGDYSRSSHQYWQVVDSDPKGLNCRMGPYTKDEIYDPGRSFKMDIFNWRVIGTLKKGQTFENELGPAGFGIMFDTRNKPWMFVDKISAKGAPKQCFVRANSQYIKPVPSPR